MWSELPQYHVFMHVKLYTKVVDYIHGHTIGHEYEKGEYIARLHLWYILLDKMSD